MGKKDARDNGKEEEGDGMGEGEGGGREGEIGGGPGVKRYREGKEEGGRER